MAVSYRTDPRQLDIIVLLARILSQENPNASALDGVEAQTDNAEEGEERNISCVGENVWVSDLWEMVPSPSPHVCRTIRDGEKERG